MTKSVGISKKEQARRENLIDGMQARIIEMKTGEWDPFHAFEEYHEEGLTLEEFVVSAIYRLDFWIGHELDKLRNTVFDIKKELEALIKDHKHAKDGSACKPI